MSGNRISELTKEFSTNPAPALDALNQISARFGIQLPNDYLGLMEISNGSEGKLGEGSYLILWSVEHILSVNEVGYYMREGHPEYLLFGSNAATAVYAFDMSFEVMPVVELDSYDPKLIRRAGTDFGNFMEELARA